MVKPIAAASARRRRQSRPTSAPRCGARPREWLQHGAVPAHPDLLTDLTGLDYGHTIREGRDALILERKEDMEEAEACVARFGRRARPELRLPPWWRASTRAECRPGHSIKPNTTPTPTSIGAAPGDLTTKSNTTRSPGTYAGRRTRTIVSAATGAAVSARGQSRYPAKRVSESA